MAGFDGRPRGAHETAANANVTSMATPYETLGVARNASQDEIRKAYRKAAKETHPDLNPGKPEAEARFKEVNAAYDIIGDEQKRKRFDSGEIDETGAEKPPERHYYREYAEANPNFRYSAQGRQGPRATDGGAEFDYDIFSDLFGERGGSERFRMPPQDVRYALEVDFLDAVKGARKTVHMPDGKTLDIAIPEGIEDGQTLRLKGQGRTGTDGKAGDAYVEITVRPSSVFQRNGYDILSTVPVSLGEALNGASVRIDTVDGPVELKIPKLAKEGSKLRLRGKGVPKKGGGRGDQFVQIRIQPPEGADEELARFMTEWEAKHPQNPRRKGAT
jgi:DnaJ-class molecular chaperone